jgi:hypothetical protein
VIRELGIDSEMSKGVGCQRMNVISRMLCSKLGRQRDEREEEEGAR